MSLDVLAYFLTWTCYGTYLPGDSRGWTRWHRGDQLPRPRLEDWTRQQLQESAVFLNDEQRQLVEDVVRQHCECRNWSLHAVNCRSNHCHVVVTAPDHPGEQVREQLKAWATRRLKKHEKTGQSAPHAIREKWWTSKGSVRSLFDDTSLEAAIKYTRDAQDIGGSKASL